MGVGCGCAGSLAAGSLAAGSLAAGSLAAGMLLKPAVNCRSAMFLTLYFDFPGFLIEPTQYSQIHCE